MVWGAEDRMVPRSHAEAYVRGLGDARLEIVAGGGHSVHVERPEEVAARLDAFLAAR